MVDTISWPMTVGNDGNLVAATGLEGLRQKVVARLSIFRGEWFLDVREGVPYFQDILTKPIDPGYVASLLNAEIRKETEVTGIRDVTAGLDPATREFSYTAVVQTVFGDMTVEV